MTWFHGGRAGLWTGAKLFPPSITSVMSIHTGDLRYHNDKVYVVDAISEAALFAAGVDGWVYEVIPLGPLVPDPDWRSANSKSMMCHSAMIKRIIYTQVIVNMPRQHGHGHRRKIQP